MSGNRRYIFVFFFIFLALTSASQTNAAVKDSDADGLTDQAETDTYLTDPKNPDTDGDNLSDSEEILGGTNPLRAEDIAPQQEAGSERRQLSWLYAASVLPLLGLGLFFISRAIRKKSGFPAAPAQTR